MASSISTRRGDGGTGQILYGPRVSKASPRLEACGAADELGAHLGLCRAEAVGDELAGRLEALQRELFAVGAQAVAQRLLGITQKGFGLVVANAQLVYRRMRSSLSDCAGRFDGLLQRAAQVFVKCLHHGESGLSGG